MADRYWVGGTAVWDSTAGTKWAASSGGPGGESLPTSADDVYFDAASGIVLVTLSGTRQCRSLTFTGFTGSFSGTGTLLIYGDLLLSAGMTWGNTGALTMSASSGSWTITTAGKTLNQSITLSAGTATWTLLDALTCTGISINGGTFNTNNYNVTAVNLFSSGSNTRTINLGSSTVTLSGSGAAIAFSNASNLTFNAGTSQINITSTSSPSIAAAASGGSSLTFYNVSFTGASFTSASLAGASTFNNLTFAGRTTAGVNAVVLSSDQTINGTLTFSAGTNATMRTFVRSDTIGTTRTLTCNTVAALTDIDFRDITIAGAAVSGGNLTGTRLGDCKGNSGITFDAAKTVYWNLAGTGTKNWSDTAWAASDGASPAVTNFPLAQDTAIFQSTSPASGVTIAITATYNIGTVDMSARTSNTMTLATSTIVPTIYGNWINGTGTTLTGTGFIFFIGRGAQTITSAGKTFTQPISINSPGGTVTLQDAITLSNSNQIQLNAGTFDAVTYNVTGGGIAFLGSAAKTVAIGSGTWTLALNSSFPWQLTGSNLTVTGTGTISLTSASGKVFQGGGIQTYPTLNQGGAGTLTVAGSNKFADITNTYAATGATSVLFTAGTTNEFTSFNLTGQATRVCTLGSTTTSQAILKKSNAWLMGANSTDGGNNTGLSFTAGGGIDYLNVSYINGVVPNQLGNFLVFFL